MGDVADIRFDTKAGLEKLATEQFERAEALAIENSALRNTLQLAQAPNLDVERVVAGVAKRLEPWTDADSEALRAALRESLSDESGSTP
jgi:hypothetical protein